MVRYGRPRRTRKQTRSHVRQVTWSENIYALNDRAETLDLYKANRAERVSP